jgi:hypothetical protein
MLVRVLFCSNRRREENGAHARRLARDGPAAEDAGERISLAMEHMEGTFRAPKLLVFYPLTGWNLDA